MSVGKFYKHRNMVDVCIEVKELLNNGEMNIVWWHSKYKTMICEDTVPIPVKDNLKEWFEVKL